MKITIINICFIVLILMSVYSTRPCFGQHTKLGGSKMWSPPDKSFTIEVPVKLKEVKVGDKNYFDLGYESSKSFRGEEASRFFTVAIINLDDSRAKMNSKEKFNEFDLISRNQNPANPFPEKYFDIDGLPAKEVLVEIWHQRYMVIDGGDKLFMFALGVKNIKDLNSVVAKRFFTSFHLLK